MSQLLMDGLLKSKKMEMSMARSYIALIHKFGFAPQNENMDPKERMSPCQKLS